MKSINIKKIISLSLRTIIESIAVTFSSRFTKSKFNREIESGLREKEVINDSSDLREVESILTISRTLKLLPWANNCLLRSLIMIRVLSRYGVASRLRIGCSGSVEDFKAHAWISVNGVDYFRYGPKGSFAILAATEREMADKIIQ